MRQERMAARPSTVDLPKNMCLVRTLFGYCRCVRGKARLRSPQP
ncbi:hypothetical protein BCF44_12357 [Kutzneria buriramensis]|uniref:Uncharacterized protein n=1 Tax=Kutzneria buriramensis TaxID=1045776 RepID=A0A3E0GVK8_9PSEU|nr:hypothetical protein BCF44_12357 [Kutzneria buriramensis]